MEMNQLLDMARQKDGSDIHLSVGMLPAIRIMGELQKIEGEDITGNFMEKLIEVITSDEQRKKLYGTGDLDMAYEDSSGL